MCHVADSSVFVTLCVSRTFQVLAQQHGQAADEQTRNMLSQGSEQLI